MRWVPSIAEATAILVTFLWSTSYVLIKLGLPKIPPLDFAAYRYSLASLVLLVASSIKRPNTVTAKWTKEDVLLVVVLGLLGYTLAQGLQFVGLDYLPAVTTSFLQNFTPVFVLCIAYPLLREAPIRLQYIGLGVALAGVLAFFAGQPLEAEATGVVVVLLGSVAWAAYLVIVKKAKVAEKLGALRFTTLTMGAGSLMLLAAALVSGGAPSLGLDDWLIIVWLSLLNTAFAFYLWNVALKTLKAFELSILQNTMLVQIALLSWYFLGEEITLNMAIGMALILVGSGIVQVPEFRPALFRRKEKSLSLGPGSRVSVLNQSCRPHCVGNVPPVLIKSRHAALEPIFK